MREITEKTIKKEIHFEKGETLSISLSIKNVSPNTDIDDCIQLFDSLYERTKKTIMTYR